MPLVDEPAAPDRNEDAQFDLQWTLHLAAIALEKLEAEGSPYVQVLRAHLAGDRPDRNKLWIARRKLIAGIRREIALTTRSHREFEEEVAYLSRYLER